MPLPFQFNADSGPSLQPVYRRLSQSISDAIAGGQLESGAALPPSRDLARELGVSRDTILRAYEELAALNLITTSATRGTFVCAPAARRQERDQVRKLNLDRLSSRGRYFQKELSRGPIFIDFAELNFCASPADLLPAKRWREITQKLSLPENFDYLAKPQDVLGRPELREALANFLNRSKAMGCDAEDVAVFSVSLHAMSVVCDLLLDAGDTIAIETPCYSGIREVARSHGLNIFPVPVDKEGLIVSRLQQCEERIKLVYVTPAHQDPTGVTMSLARRKELLAWAKRNDAWIIEDDFDGWFHYGSPPPPSLRAMDEDDRVIYVANFWQLLYPLTTLSYCLPPANLMPLLREAKKHSEAFTEPLAQLALASMLNDNYLDKHLRKTKATFADRRRNLIYALKSSLADKVQIAGMTAGMHLLVRFPEHEAEQVEAAAGQVGLQLMPTARLYLDQHESSDHRPLYDQGRTREFIVSFAMTESESASIKCQAFAASLKAQSTPEASFSTIDNETATDAWTDLRSAAANMKFHTAQLGMRGSNC